MVPNILDDSLSSLERNEFGCIWQHQIAVGHISNRMTRQLTLENHGMGQKQSKHIDSKRVA